MKIRLLLGYLLIVLSCIAWAVLPMLPFLPASNQQLLAWAGVVFVIAELTWWVAILLFGPEMIDLAKRYWRVITQCRRCARRRCAEKSFSKGAND